MTLAVLHARRAMALFALLLAVPLLACAGADPRPAALMEAYAAVDAARSDRRVRALAPAGLYDAEAALAEAFRAWQAGEPGRQVNRLAVLARERAQTARLHAIERLAGDAIAILEAQAPQPAPEPASRAVEASVAPPGRPAEGADALLLDAGPIAPAAAPPPAAGAPSARLHLNR